MASASLESGVIVSRYRILEPLGRGGMGEVYKAWDPTLERNIALKILPPELVKNPDRVRRFVQEAKSASALNHPHIVTIHDVGQARLTIGDEGEVDVQYIAMELIDGETLRRKMNEGASLRSLVGWLGSAADGVSKAHAAGIVHRDLKPENIMISRDGFAKVLDFGLAKLVEKSDPTIDANDRTDVRGDTAEGTLVGTVGYMSPEQVLGKVVDYRSDIFSFGAILYEAATGKKPFAADSNVDVMHKIVHDKPEPVDRFNPGAPGELRRIIRRCLAKEPDSRYHSMKDLAIELRELHDDWDELSASSDPRSSSESIERPAVTARRRRWLWPALIAVVVPLAGLIAIVLVRRRPESSSPQFKLDRMQMTALTTDPNVVLAALSPDGKYLAYETRDDGSFALHLKQIATGSIVQVVAPQPNQIVGFSFSRDSNYLFYAARENNLSEYNYLYSVPTLGGTPRKLLFDIDSGVAFSPDSKRMVAFRGLPQNREGDLIVANTDGTAARVLAAVRGEEQIEYVTPSWSPDGRWIATMIFSTRGSDHEELALFDASTGNRQRLGDGSWYSSSNAVAWAPDGSGVYITASPKPNGGVTNEIWFVSFPAGSATRLFNDTNRYDSISLSADGRSLVAVQSNTSGSMTVVNPDGSTRPVDTRDTFVFAASATSADRIIYSGFVNDTGNLWMIDAAGNRQQLTTAGRSIQPTLSADGKTVGYRCNRNNQWMPCVMQLDSPGEKILPAQLTQVTSVDPTPDGREVLFVDAKRDLVRMPVAGGPAKVLVSNAGLGFFSPDGKRIAVSVLEPISGKMIPKLLILDASSGAVLKKLDWFMERWIAWTSDGNGIGYFSNVTPRNAFVQPLDGSPVKQITHYDGEDIFSLCFTSDGKMIVVRGETRSSAVEITDFR